MDCLFRWHLDSLAYYGSDLRANIIEHWGPPLVIRNPPFLKQWKILTGNVLHSSNGLNMWCHVMPSSNSMTNKLMDTYSHHQWSSTKEGKILCLFKFEYKTGKPLQPTTLPGVWLGSVPDFCNLYLHILLQLQGAIWDSMAYRHILKVWCSRTINNS